MESVCGESNGWGSPPILRSFSSESVTGESVSAPIRRTFQSESIGGETAITKTFKQTNSPDTPRIRQLKKELSELQTELELAQQIDQIKQKIKKYPR